MDTSMAEVHKKIRILQVVFDTEIFSYEIPAFRGAIINKVGKEHILFHNHTENDGFRYKYPLIQYKVIGKKPAIVCVDYGVDEIHRLFENNDWSISISGRTIDLKIDKLNLNRFTMNVWDKYFKYNIKNWVALNQENYKKYLALDSLSEQSKFLESLLKANILSFAKGIEWQVPKPVDLSITDILDVRTAKIKDQKVLGFNLDFKCNVFIPNYIGLGKSVSLGYGNVREIRTKR